MHGGQEVILPGLIVELHCSSIFCGEFQGLMRRWVSRCVDSWVKLGLLRGMEVGVQMALHDRVPAQ